MLVRHPLLHGELLLASDGVAALADETHRLNGDLFEWLPGGKDVGVPERLVAGQLPRQRLHGSPFDARDARDLFQHAQVGLVVKLGPTWG